MDKRAAGADVITAQYIGNTFKLVEEIWPSFEQQLSQVVSGALPFSGDPMARFGFALAAVATDSQALHNLTTPAQAKLLLEWIEKHLDTPPYGDYAISEVRAYGKCFQECLSAKNGNPVDAVSARLLCHLFGTEARRLEVKFDGKGTGLVDPIAISIGTASLIPFAGHWKAVFRNVDITEAVFPSPRMDLQSLGFHEPGGAPPRTRPNGSWAHYSDDGSLVVRSGAPGLLDNTVSFITGRRLLSVRVKGFWEGVREADLYLSGSASNRLIESDGHVYALAVAARGRVSLEFVPKRVWDLSEEVQAVIATEGLSESERKARIAAILSRG